MDMIDTLLYIVIAAAVTYWGSRFIIGRRQFKVLEPQLEADGILLSERRVFTRFNFPMIKRITFTHVFLTQRRFVLCHCITRNKVLQVPLAHPGSTGNDEAWFEVEQRGNRKVLLLRTTLRGGGRIRLHVTDPDEWLEQIREN